jgi:hypothetical protein
MKAPDPRVFDPSDVGTVPKAVHAMSAYTLIPADPNTADHNVQVKSD